AIATPTFAPISAKLTFGEGEKLRKEFELKYQDGRVTGWASGKGKIDVEVLSDTVDQRIDWAAAMSQELVPGREFAVHVFDPGTGASRVTGHILVPKLFVCLQELLKLSELFTALKKLAAQK